MGLKKIETRSWYTNYRGHLLIHAAKRRPTKSDFYYICSALKDFGYDEQSLLSDLPLGMIVCEVNLIYCTRTMGYIPDGLEGKLGDYTKGRFMWTTENSKRFAEPIPWKGQQGFFNVPDEVIK
jgi:hypothetical protein